MTDDRLEKVRAEVERLRQKVMGVRTDFADGQKGVLTELLSFIDSMQKEPKFKIGQIITDPEDKTFTFHINRIEDGKYIESDDAWVLIKDADEEYELVEEPVSEDLEQAIDTYLATYFGGEKEMQEWPFLKKMAIYFAEWQKEQFEKNRLTACDRQTEEEAEIESDFVMSIIENEHRQPTFDDAIKYGMKLQEKKDQETIELAEDHAMLAGMVKGKEETIEKACNYLHEHREEVKTEDNGIAGWISDEFIENFRKNMEE